MFVDERPTKRTLGARDRKLLWERANHRCEACGKLVDSGFMEVGHKTAWSRGGGTSLRNSVCLCHECNLKQGTDSWVVFLKKLGKEPEDLKRKNALKALTLTQLKYIAKENKIVLQSKTEENIFSSRRIAPSKTRYVNALSKLTPERINSTLKKMPEPAKKKRKRKSDSWF
jgi:hypothetical protein